MTRFEKRIFAHPRKTPMEIKGSVGEWIPHIGGTEIYYILTTMVQ